MSALTIGARVQLSYLRTRNNINRTTNAVIGDVAIFFVNRVVTGNRRVDARQAAARDIFDAEITRIEQQFDKRAVVLQDELDRNDDLRANALSAAIKEGFV
jgi:hypothetical protein